MTSFQLQPAPRNDSHVAKATRKTGASSQTGTAPDDGAAFSGMLAASQRQLEADRLAAMKDNSAASSESKNNFDFLPDDNTADDGANTDSAQRMLPMQNDVQGQASQAAALPTPTSNSSQVKTTPEDSPDLQTLASLLPAGTDDGVFEVLMPNRGKVGVTVSDMPDGLSYLLMPDDALLADRLRSHEMELESMLRRRIRRNVKIAVL